MAEQIFDDYLGQFRVALDPQYFIESFIQTHKVWDPISAALIGFFVKPGDICIDVGANAGFVSLAMAKQAMPAGRVFSFEPNVLTYNRFKTNLSLNPGLEQTIKLEKLGIGEASSELNIYHAGGFGNAYMAKTAIEKLSGSDSIAPDDHCQVIRLDDYPPLQDLKNAPLRLLKIDVEGMELQVLRGATKLIAQHHPIILYETLLEYFEPQEIVDIEGFLREQGYVILGVTQALKLRATSFPDYGENTVAIWHPEIPRYLDGLHNASQFSVEVVGNDRLSEQVAQQFRSIVVACLEPNVVYLAINHTTPEIDTPAAYQQPGPCELGVSAGTSLQVGFPNMPYLSAWTINFTDKEFISYTGTIRLPEGTVMIRGDKFGGYLEHL